MKKTIFALVSCALFNFNNVRAQVISNASFMKAHKSSDIDIPFRFTDEGEATPIQWGLDLAWLSEDNVRTGSMFAGKEIIDIVRVSYQPWESVEDGLTTRQKSDIQKRYNIVKKWLKGDIMYNVNSDHGDNADQNITSWYRPTNATTRTERWTKVIDLTIDEYKRLGLTNLVSISPFNEPDYGWNQGYSSSTRKSDFLNIAKSLKNNFEGKYDGVRICGGNTLNCDQAYDWWNYLKTYLDEGNTHQLAGSFDKYASFFKSVRNYGHHATADELHNTMEAMVGVEYGMQTGIWWGTAEHTRSQFMKATYQGNPGKRLAYSENRTNWVAGSVYRHVDGKVQGFVGTSERQARATTFRFMSTDRPVWYNGERGREWTVSTPGSSQYQSGQTNAEALVNIQSGEDIMPYVGAGTFKIVNVNSGLVMGFSETTVSSGNYIKQWTNSNVDKKFQWTVVPVDVVGDFTYFSLQNGSGKNMVADILNWNYNAGADLIIYNQTGGRGTNEQFYLDYAGNGAFYIRSRYNAKCLGVASKATGKGYRIQMQDCTNEPHQQWKFMPVDKTPNKVAPASPTNLTATANNASVKLTWEAPADTDLRGYIVLRSEDGEDFYTIANEVTTTEFTDNEAEDGVTYYYKVKAQDFCLNTSPASNTVSESSHGESALVMSLPLINSLNDETENGNHGVHIATATYTEKNERTGVALNGSSDFIQLPYTVANHDAITISCWVFYQGGSQWQRIFDFGNGTEQYMFLTANNGTGLSFAIKNRGSEQKIAGKTLTQNTWHHLAITLGEDGGKMYLDGAQIGTNKSINIKPSDIKPIFNYIGHSMFTADPNFKGIISDFQIYSTALSAEEISNIATSVSPIIATDRNENSEDTYDLSGRKVSKNHKGIIIKKDTKLINKL